MEETVQDNKSYIAADNYGPVTQKRTIATGADLVKGTILGKVTASGKFIAYASGNADGSEVARCVLLEDAAAAAADAEAVVGYAGVYVKDNMTGLDAPAEEALEARGLYFQ